MSQHTEPQSLQMEVVRSFGKNYRSFLRRRKHEQSNRESVLKKIYSEEIEAVRRHSYNADNMGFS